MIHYAHDCNFQNIAHLIQLIFEAIFEEGKNVSSVETLVQLAKEAGLDYVELDDEDYAEFYDNLESQKEQDEKIYKEI